MRIEALTVALRPRSAWEAVELGTALVRRHARAVWAPWLALTLPVFVALNAAAWALDVLWLAPLVMWWLKPVFDRVPLFVLSRAVFGEVPDVRATLRGAFRDGRRAMWGYLLWRRLTPARSLLLPVDMLEGGDSRQAGARRAAVAGPAYGVAALTWLVFAHFEIALVLGMAAFALLLVPPEYMQGAMQVLVRHLQDIPDWIELLQNVLFWIATSVLEPFYVGAGFAQYLNRRTEIEAWDIDLAFRRLARRLTGGAGTALLVALLALPFATRAQDTDAGAPAAPVAQSAAPSSAATPPPARARSRAPRCPLPLGESSASARTLPEVFGDAHRDERPFLDAVEQAYKDPRLTRTRKVTTWERRNRTDRETTPGRMPQWLRAVLSGIATAGELLLWALLALVVGVLAWTARRWWPWLRAAVSAEPPAPSPVVERDAPVIAPLPEDIADAARREFAQGRPREALALLYRGGVEAMLALTGQPLPPGATEAECLRAATALPAEARTAFARIVRLWQYAAYADRMPDAEAFEAALTGAAPHFGWRA